MPIAKVQLEDGRVARFEVPEGTTPDQVTQFAQSQFSQPSQSKGDTLELSKEPGTLELLGKGFKSGIKGVGQGIGQVLGVTSREDVARSRAEDKPVLDTTAGTIGNVAGTVAGYLPEI